MQGEFTYEVTETLIVSPTQVEVLEDKGDNRLTLIGCHPKYSARQRIVVVSQLAADEEPLPPPPTRRRSRTPADARRHRRRGRARLAGDPPRGRCARASGCSPGSVGRRWRKWPAYLIGFPFFMVALFFFFEEFSRLLPSNF